jgi:predicted metal-dependent peptidase
VSPDRLTGLLQELVDENPFAIRAVLRICEVRFTCKVPTLAVTCEDRPALLVNLDFISENCRNDSEVKAALCHEFLHVLLRHTETIGPITPARHLALDAVINAIIHRSFGPDWSSLMSHYYQGVSDLRKLLRPMNAGRKGHVG